MHIASRSRKLAGGGGWVILTSTNDHQTDTLCNFAPKDSCGPPSPQQARQFTLRNGQAVTTAQAPVNAINIYSQHV